MSRYLFVKANDEGQVPLLAIDVAVAVAADCLSFLNDIIDCLQSEKAALEAEANAQGSTINHSLVRSFGSIPLDPQSPSRDEAKKESSSMLATIEALNDAFNSRFSEKEPR